jgi:secretion/DNA translocation related TadE-like protein
MPEATPPVEGSAADVRYRTWSLVEVRGVAGILRALVPGRRRAGRLSWAGCDERSADRGAATVWVVGGIAVFMTVMMAVFWFGGAVAARHEAEGAADLGALAAAVAAVGGEQAACAEARWVVERMGAVLLSCRLSGWDALVEADVSYAPFGSAAARARAGPVELTP